MDRLAVYLSDPENDNTSDDNDYGAENARDSTSYCKRAKQDIRPIDESFTLEGKLPIPPEIIALDPTKTCSFQELPRRRKRKMELNTHANIGSTENVSHCAGSQPDTKMTKHELSLPSRCTCVLANHLDKVNHVEWSKPDGHHLLSTSMDGTVKIWNPFAKSSPDGAESGMLMQNLSGHGEAVREAKWHKTGGKVLSGGYDKTARLWDVETGKVISAYNLPSYVTALEFHPSSPDLFVVGCSDSTMKSWDARNGSVVATYFGSQGQIQDLEFLRGATEFLSAADAAQRSGVDKAIAVWDFRTGAPISIQIYLELYTCTCLKLHPRNEHFIAQSHGNYMALFSARPPYKMNKRKRYEGGHQVAGYPINCSFSPDGSLIATGSSDGSIWYYHSDTARTVMCKRRAHLQAPCTDVQFHPVLSTTIASCGWDSVIKVWQ
eukprot:m.26476 g.26476  ORF g.26476 m.26476 type:complete len:435 (+) comp29345_c0_seq1:151-1455(+)